jgi:solute carrier family 25 protein 38
MCYTQLKASFGEELDSDRLRHHSRLFAYGIISGFIASILTNPIDVLKTTIQAAPSEMDGGNPKVTMRQVAYKVIDGRMGFLRLFDGLVPRSARRTLISASTWTFYELMTDLIHFQ